MIIYGKIFDKENKLIDEGDFEAKDLLIKKDEGYNIKAIHSTGGGGWVMDLNNERDLNSFKECFCK